MKYLFLMAVLLAGSVQAQEATTKVQLELKDLQAIVQYLAKQPYIEVVQILQPALNAKPVEQCEKTEPKEGKKK